MPKIRFFQKALFDFVGVVCFFHVGIRQEISQLIRHLWRDCLGEFNVECDVQITLDKGISPTGHTFLGYHHHVWHGSSTIGIFRLTLDDFTWFRLHDDVSTIQVLEAERKSSQRLVQADILHNQQVRSFSFEQIVFLFLYDEIDISGLSSRCFVCHSLEGNLLVVVSTLFHVNFNDFSFVFGFCLIALSLTLGARTLHLRDHSGP
mmetsp:Transcript_9791/g.17894  ORF Transcript_9791/g.17894 Transcript_9791/m.17894 type:complete len:205 (-) Transcript_9791:683-1297(-)